MKALVKCKCKKKKKINGKSQTCMNALVACTFMHSLVTIFVLLKINVSLMGFKQPTVRLRQYIFISLSNEWELAPLPRTQWGMPPTWDQCLKPGDSLWRH